MRRRNATGGDQRPESLQCRKNGTVTRCTARSTTSWPRSPPRPLEEFGEHETARLFQTDSEEFDRIYEAGRQFFHGTENEESDSEDDEWLDELCRSVADCVEAESPEGTLGVRCREEGRKVQRPAHYSGRLSGRNCFSIRIPKD